MPFRQAHQAVGAAARLSGRLGKALSALSAVEWRSIHPRFEKDVLRCFDARRSLSRRELPGAPGPKAVAGELRRWERALGLGR